MYKLDSHFTQDAKEVIKETIDVIRKAGANLNKQTIWTLTYLMFKSAETKHNADGQRSVAGVPVELHEILNPGCFCRPVLYKNDSNYNDEAIMALDTLAAKYNPQVFKHIFLVLDILEGIPLEMDEDTPSNVCRLALRLMNVEQGDWVVDIACKAGNMIPVIIDSKIECGFLGFDLDIDRTCCDFAEIRRKFGEIDGCVDSGSFYSLSEDCSQYEGKKKYFVVLPFYEFGHDCDALTDESKDDNRSICIPFDRSWDDCRCLCHCLKEGDKACVIIPSGKLSNLNGKEVREQLVRKGFVEQVINLPPKLFDSVAVSLSAIVFSKGNERARFIDATGCCVLGRRQNTLSFDNIATIVSMANYDSQESCAATPEQIAEQDYSLVPARFLAERKENVFKFSPHIETQEVRFEDVVVSYRRGSTISAKELDELISQEPTNYMYLKLSSVENGFIIDELPYLKTITSDQEKFCIKTGDFLLSKNGNPFRMAVAEVPEGKKILANGNFYIIELDSNKVLPSYIKAFFESPLGQSKMKGIIGGSAIPMITVRDLMGLGIPLPSLDVQRCFSDAYEKKVQEIHELQNRLKTSMEELKGMFAKILG